MLVEVSEYKDNWKKLGIPETDIRFFIGFCISYDLPRKRTVVRWNNEI